MNPTLLKASVKAARKGFDKFRDYSAQKADETYDVIAQAAEAIKNKDTDELFEDVRREAGTFTKVAKERLGDALSTASDRVGDLADAVKSGEAKETLSKVASDTRNTLSDAASEAGAKISAVASDASSKVSSAATDASKISHCFAKRSEGWKV